MASGTTEPGKQQPARRVRRQTRRAARAVAESWPGTLTLLALGLALTLVIVRATMTESLRTVVFFVSGSDREPRSPGPATALLLDLLQCVPALLVLGRQVLDREFSLRFSWSMLPMGLLAAWTALSTIWATDRFAAAVSAANWCSALVLMWAFSQIVRSWTEFRLVAGVAFGLLLVLILAGLNYRLLDWPELKQNWAKNSVEMLRSMNKDPNSRDAEQLGKNVISGRPLGFSVSSNSYAAFLVLLANVGAGTALQRLRSRDHVGWIVPAVLSVIPFAMLMAWTQSKAAIAAAGLSVAFQIAFQVMSWRSCRIDARRAYWTGVGIIVLGAMAVVGHGLYHHTLPTDSLAFRWIYWVGSASLFKAHPLIGVGWENFGQFYLAHRLANAPEEIRDPHNFFVRIAVELGVVGAVMLVAWMLRLWWELSAAGYQSTSALEGSAPRTDPFDNMTPAVRTSVGQSETDITSSPWRLSRVIILTIAAAVFGVAVTVDFTMPAEFIAFEIIKHAAFLLALGVGVLTVVPKALAKPDLDDRPAPVILTATLIAVGMFLLQNLVDFSLFEPAGMCLFAMLAGAALGIRLSARDAGAAPPAVASRRGRAIAGVTLGVAVVAWLSLAAELALPTAHSEAIANTAQNHLRVAMTLLSPGNVNNQRASAYTEATMAAAAYESAFHKLPFNADYAYEAGKAWAFAGRPDHAARMFAAAIAADGSAAVYHVSLAEAELQASSPGTKVVSDEFGMALALDPHNLTVRLDFAGVLEKFGDRAAALEQYRIALDDNSKLSREENKRLPDEKVSQIEQHMASLRR